MNTSVAVICSAMFLGGLFFIIWRKDNKTQELEMKIKALQKEIVKIKRINNDNSVHKNGYKYSPENSALREWMKWE